MYEICFLATAINDTYEEFLIPFTLCATQSHPNGFVEMVVVNDRKFMNKFKHELAELIKITTRFSIRNFLFPLNHHIPNTYRFFEKSFTESVYTYIMDIDVMLLENVVPHFEQHFPYPKNKIYNNVIRPGTKRLTGMHFVNTKKYFTPALRQVQIRMYNDTGTQNDEEVLYKIVKAVHPLPPQEFRYRPILGIHFSPNRGPQKCMQLVTYMKYANAFKSLARAFPKLFQFSIFKKLYNQLEEEFIIE